MQRAVDSKIQAQVRILLARRWVDLRALTIGTTNGVVYVGGALKAGGPGAPATPNGPSEGVWAEKLRREIAQIPDVRDVVFRFEDQGATGEPWQKSA
jgi:hypothetical protein